MTYSIIEKIELEDADRFDAEYFENKNAFKNFYLGNQIVDFIQYGTSEDLNEVGLGYPTLRLNEFDSFFIKMPQKYCNEINKVQFTNLSLKKNDILICRTNGNAKLVGKSAIVMEDKPFAFASYLFRLRTKKEIISPATLLVYLHSSFGRDEIQKNMMTSNQTNFSPARFKLIKIPKINKTIQHELDCAVLNSFNLSRDSITLYQQAEDLFLKELGLKSFKPRDDLYFITDLDEVVKNSYRIDADYFQPKYKELVSKIKHTSKTLNDIFLIRRGDFIDTNFYVEKSKRRYIRIKELQEKGELNINDTIYIDDNITYRNLDRLIEGDFIFAGIGATLGKTACISKELEGSFYSNNTIRFRLKDNWKEHIDIYYLQIVFQSFVCRLQFEQKQAQTAQAKISDDELKTVLIPVLPKQKQQEIADLVKKSHQARKKSKELLEEAKRKVEEMIEKGGEN